MFALGVSCLLAQAVAMGKGCPWDAPTPGCSVGPQGSGPVIIGTPARVSASPKAVAGMALGARELYEPPNVCKAR